MLDSPLERLPGLSVVYKKTGLAICRQIANEWILIPLREETSKKISIYSLNEVAAHIWRLVDGQSSVGQIIDELSQEYRDVQSETLRNDIQQLLRKLEGLAFILRVEE